LHLIFDRVVSQKQAAFQTKTSNSVYATQEKSTEKGIVYELVRPTMAA
jgi:hypothetical protein